jgi:hypothetical protein
MKHVNRGLEQQSNLNGLSLTSEAEREKKTDAITRIPCRSVHLPAKRLLKLLRTSVSADLERLNEFP